MLRQRKISVTSQEGTQLEVIKQSWEAYMGVESDWGAFLTGIALLGMTGIGVYGLAKVVDSGDQYISVECPGSSCPDVFRLAIPMGLRLGVVIEAPGPACDCQLVVLLRKRLW